MGGAGSGLGDLACGRRGDGGRDTAGLGGITGGSPSRGSLPREGYVRLRPTELGERICFGDGCDGDGRGVFDDVLDKGGGGEVSSGIEAKFPDWDCEGIEG